MSAALSVNLLASVSDSDVVIAKIILDVDVNLVFHSVLHSSLAPRPSPFSA